MFNCNYILTIFELITVSKDIDASLVCGIKVFCHCPLVQIKKFKWTVHPQKIFLKYV